MMSLDYLLFVKIHIYYLLFKIKIIYRSNRSSNHFNDNFHLKISK